MSGDTHDLLVFLKRKHGMSFEGFRDHYEGHHVPLSMKYMAGPMRYTRRYIETVEAGPAPEFDVVTELCFPDAAMRDAVLAALANDKIPAEIIADEQRFVDRSRSRFHASTNFEIRTGDH